MKHGSVWWVFLVVLPVVYCQPSSAPTTLAPTIAPTTSTPTTSAPTAAPTQAPTIAPTIAPTTQTPTTPAPTLAPTLAPTTHTPTTPMPTGAPTTSTPTGAPTTAMPTASPTTATPTTATPTAAPTTAAPTVSPTTAVPTTGAPTMAPTTPMPTLSPTTAMPTPPTLSPTSSPTAQPTTGAPTLTPTTAIPTTAMPTLRPTFAPTQCPIYCLPRDGPVYCPNLHMGCDNGGYFSRSLPCAMSDLARVMYVNAATKFANDYTMLPSQYCICPSGYRGASCSIPLPKTCTDQNKLFDGNFGILPTSPTKNFYCRVFQRNFGALLTLIHHRMLLTVHPGGEKVSFVIHTRLTVESQPSVPGVAENTSYMHDLINAELDNCTVQFTDLVAKTVRITCLQNTLKTCQSYDDGRMPQNCGWFYTQYLTLINPNKPATAEFLVVNNTEGTGSGSIALPAVFGNLVLDFECDTGVCVDDLDFTNVTVAKKDEESIEDELPAILGGTFGGLAGLFLVLGALWFFMRRQPKKILLDATEDNLATALAVDEKTLADGIGLAWENVSYFIKASVGKSTITRCLNTTRKQILHSHFGLVTPGQVCAILGPSGAGKTSLLNILADRRSNYEGQVHLVGRAVTGIARRDVISYVQQYDSLMATQTVRESLRFSAMLRIPNASKMRSQIEARINDLLARLKISHIADSVIGTHEKGGISGGERKRVDIGIELITNPALLLLDEPTSGLDSNNVDVLLGVLRNVASLEKCAILLTIHQVSGRDFMAFDSVLIMTNRGKTAFFGPPAKAVEHCKLSASPEAFGPLDNPAEVLLKEAVVVNDEQKSGGNMMSNNWEQSAARTQMLDQIRTHLDDEDRKAKRATVVALADRPVRACPVQFYYLFQRGLRNLSRDLSLFLLTTLFSVLISVFVGLVFYQIDDSIPGLQNRFGLMFFLCIFFCLTSLSSLGKFVGNRTVFKREMDSGYYRVLPYYLSECLTDLVPLRILPPIIFALILTPMVGLQATSEKIELLIGILILLNLVAAAMCLMVSAGSSSIGQANYIAVLITIVSLIFGGLILSNDSTSDLSQIKVVSFIHYAYESLMANELHGKNYFFNPKGYNDLKLSLPGDIYLANYGMSYDNLQSNLGYLVIFLVGFLFLGYVFLLNIPGTLRNMCVRRRAASASSARDKGMPLEELKKAETQ